jgi:hypothetical protein
MVIKRMKVYDPDYFSWGDLRCNNCNSANVVKFEDKGVCSNTVCKKNPESCKTQRCEKSTFFTTRNTIQHKFICRNCRNVWTEFRKVI